MSLLDRGSSANIAAAAVSAALLSIIVPARGQRVLGLDVSTWQGNLSTTTWATFKRPTDQQVSGVFGDGRDFVMIRSSRGGTTGEDHRQGGYPSGNNTFYNLSQRYDDPYFVQNINRATTAGMFAGSYHFARADILASTLNSDGVTTAGVANNGTDEADHFIQMAGVWMRPGYLLPALDLEAGASQHTTAELSSFAVAFSDRIYQQMGIRPMIYVNSSYANSEVNSTVAATFPILWIARPSTGDPLTTEPPPALPTYPNVYGVWNPSYPTIPTPQPWKFWQYDSGGGLNGYSGNIDKNAANGGMEFLKDYLVPAIWVTNSDGQWTTQTNWNSGQTPVLPVTGAGQIAPIGTQTLPTPRLPGSEDTVILDRPSANIIVTLDSGTHTIRKLYMREALNITGGSLTIGYVPSSDSTPIAAQFSGPVSLSGSASLSVHTLQVDATQTFTLGGGALTFNTINLMPHSTTPAKLLVTGDVSFSGLASISATIANGTGSGSSGLVDLGGATRTLDVANVVSGIDLSVNVPVTNGAIIKTGTGTLGLAAANTYTGGTAIQAGRIELSGSLNSGVTVNSGGVLALGTSTGIRTVNGGLAVNAGGTFRVHINGTTAGSQYDQLRLTNGNSTATLGGTLDLIAVAGLASGSTFRILDISPSTVAVSGTFAGLPQNAEFYEDSQWWRISYTGGTGNDVELTRITPTPWQTWQLTNFPNDVNNSAIVGASVDIEGDGLVNLLEYTFGGNPSVASPTSLPQVSMLGGRLALTFTRVVANTDLTITVQGADNAAGPWTSLAASVNGGVTAPLGAATVTETGSGATRSVEVRDLYLTTDPMHPKRFMKVQVTKQ
jgi:autotransporter-associated beta strand protein